MTLRELFESKPEWRDLPIVVYTESRGYEFVGASAAVYEGVACTAEVPCDDAPCNHENPVVVFSGN